MLVGAVAAGARAVARHVWAGYPGGPQEWPALSRVISRAERAVQRGTPAFVTVRRKRAAQARKVSDAVIGCVEDGASRDQERIVATARIYSAVATMLLGHGLDAYGRFEALAGSGQESVAEAFRAQAANVATDAGVLAEFGAVSNLAHRARTLGQGDPHITRIAFEESTRADQPGSPRSRRGRWFARLVAPGKPRRPGRVG